MLDTLTGISLDDLLNSTGLSWLRRTPLRWLFWPAARRFATVVHEFDQRVGLHGLAQGSEWLLQRMTGGLEVRDALQVPASGPVCILANHPGMTDTVALFASLGGRADLRVIALDRPFLRALPNVAKQLIFVPEDEAGRLSVVRAGARHLKQGGALLTFPAGEIEPDPATFGAAEAMASLLNWSDSHALFTRLVPEVRLLPVIVSQVFSPAAVRHPLTHWRRGRVNKEKLAAALQVMLPSLRDAKVRVAFGAPLQTCEMDSHTLAAAVRAQAQQLIEASSPGCAQAVPSADQAWSQHAEA